MKLEDIRRGRLIAGVVPGKLARVVGAEMRGPDALELVYKVGGTLAQRRLSRAEEDDIVLASNPWLPSLSVRLFAIAVVLIGAFGAVYFWARQHGNPGPVSNDVPVVIRTNGGMLEVAKVKHRRTFNLTQVLTLAGIQVPFCKASASYTVDTHVTYRVELARHWTVSYRDRRLRVTAPKLEPALPVAFDTSGMGTTLQQCPMIPRGTQDDLLRSISGQLAKDARHPRYVSLARNQGARETVREFVQKWLITQRSYDIPRNTPIDVVFDDE